MSNNYAFIDGQNLHFGIKSLGWKLDHRKFRKYLLEEHEVERAYIFLGYMEEHQDLYNVLQEAGFICFFKPLVRYDDGSIKGNVDADMVLQVMVDIENYDNAVIVSGDGDFSGLLRHLLFRHKLGQVIIPNRDKYSSLFDRLDGFDEKHVTYMNDLKSKLYYAPGRNRNHRKPKEQTQASDPSAGKPPKQSSEPVRKPRKNQTDQKASTPQRSAKPRTQRSEKPKPSTAKKQTRPQRKPARKKSDTGFKPKAVLEASLLEAIDSVE